MSSSKASAVKRRALRVRLFSFYAVEPEKDPKDILDVCEWALQKGDGGVTELNEKLKKKYGKDLSSVMVNSFADLDLYSQLRLFYAQMEPGRNAYEVQQVAQWTDLHGMEATNELLLQRYGENLSTFAFGGQKRMMVLLKIFYEKHDPSRLEGENLKPLVDWTQINGAGRLNARLLAKYGDQVDVTIENEAASEELEEFQAKQGVKAEEVAQNSETWRKSQEHRKSMSALGRPMSLRQAGVVDEVSDKDHIIRTIELFYAKFAPQKLVNGTDDVVRFALTEGVSKLNEALRAKYDGKDLTTIEAEYERIYESLKTYFSKHNPSKLETGFEDIVAWGVVHSAEALSERLASKYGEPPVFAPKKDESGTSDAENSSGAGKTLDETAGVSTSSLVNQGDEEEKADEDRMVEDMTRLHSVVLTGEFTNLSEKLQLFYEKHDPEKLKDEEKMNSIIKWALKHGVATLNSKLKAKWGESLEDFQVEKKKAADGAEGEEALDV